MRVGFDLAAVGVDIVENSQCSVINGHTCVIALVACCRFPLQIAPTEERLMARSASVGLRLQETYVKLVRNPHYVHKYNQYDVESFIMSEVVFPCSDTIE